MANDQQLAQLAAKLRPILNRGPVAPPGPPPVLPLISGLTDREAEQIRAGHLYVFDDPELAAAQAAIRPARRH